MRKRLASLLAVAALAALVAPACARGDVAFSVGEHEVTNDDLFDELDALDRGEAFRNALQVPEIAETRGTAEGAYSQTFVRWVIEARIFFAIVDDEFERRDLEVTADDLDRARAVFASFDFDTGRELTGEQVLETLPDPYRQRWVEDQARLTALQEELGSPDAFGELVSSAAQDADVWVNSRYGRWDAANLTIEPPEGPSTTVAPQPAVEPPVAP